MKKTRRPARAARKRAAPAKKSRRRGTAAPKSDRAAPGRAMTDRQLVELARSAVPTRVRGQTAHVIRPPRVRAAMDAAAGTGIDAEVAALVGATLPPDDAS